MRFKQYGALVLSITLVFSATACARSNGVKTSQYKAHSINRNTTDGYTARSYDHLNPRDGFTARPNDRLNTRDGYTTRSTNQRNVMNGTKTPVHKDISDKIVKQVASVKGVNKATVVVHNRDVIVGLDVKSGQNTAAVTRNVKHKVEKAKPGYKVHVTTDKKMHTRIQSIHQQQMVPLDGHPVRNFATDIGVLIKDIGRTVTAPMTPPVTRPVR